MKPMPRIIPGNNYNPHVPPNEQTDCGHTVINPYRASNGFTPWKSWEDDEMERLFSHGYAPNLVAVKHRRSLGGIIARFNKINNLDHQKKIRINNLPIYNHLFSTSPYYDLRTLKDLISETPT